MADSRRRKPPLVADKRYPATKRGGTGKRATAKPKGKTAKKTAKPAARKRARAKRTRRGGRGGRGGGGFLAWIGAAIRAAFRWVLWLIWAITWRVGLVVSLLIVAAVGYIYKDLPDVTALLDGRARGSVTMLDRDG